LLKQLQTLPMRSMGARLLRPRQIEKGSNEDHLEEGWG
jgi:hypothetical protein